MPRQWVLSNIQASHWSKLNCLSIQQVLYLALQRKEIVSRMTNSAWMEFTSCVSIIVRRKSCGWWWNISQTDLLQIKKMVECLSKRYWQGIEFSRLSLLLIIILMGSVLLSLLLRHCIRSLLPRNINRNRNSIDLLVLTILSSSFMRVNRTCVAFPFLRVSVEWFLTAPWWTARTSNLNPSQF